MASPPIVAVTAQPVTLAAGGATQARITLVVADGYHVQANPASGEFLVPLQLALRGRGSVRVGKPAYPRGRPYRLPGADEDWMTYGGTLEIAVPLEAQESAPEGELALRGTLRYQACDDGSCFFPASVPVTLPVRVVPLKGSEGLAPERV
jgi:DsbC/DsbD-like thiol-disulfide interchange protein